MWFERPEIFLFKHLLPVDVFKEWLCLYLFEITYEAQPLQRIFLQKPS